MWKYDGEYLKAVEKKDNLEIEYKIKANDSIEVEIIDINTVNLEKNAIIYYAIVYYCIHKNRGGTQ